MATRAVPFGKYFLLERINVGGMAEIYKAKMVGVEGFTRLLAIKRILPAIAAEKDFISMFIDEAKISVQLTHANIAQTFELGRFGDTYFIALEYVPGRDLRAVAERLRRRGESVPPEFAAYVVSRVAEGLDYAHRKRDPNGRELGIIHRDVSPQNILVSWEGEVKLIDFGIAKAANKIMKTQAGILKGKFGYMSPEQVRGLPLDRRSDIFACGIVLYELLAGERLFTGESDYSVLEKVRNAHIPPLGTNRRPVPGPLERIVGRALAREPDDRYQWAGELVADLQRFLLGRDKLWTREDLAAWMKATFPEDFEREKRQAAEDLDAAEETPTPADAGAEPVIRAPPPRAEGHARIESRADDTPVRPMPPPPVATLERDDDDDDEPTERAGPSRVGEALRLAEALRSAETVRKDTPARPRLAEAAASAETDKVSLRRDDEAEGTRTDPEPLVLDDGPTPPEPGDGGPLPIADQPTRVQPVAAPTPVQLRPAPAARGPRPGARPLSTPGRPTPRLARDDEPTALRPAPSPAPPVPSVLSRPLSPDTDEEDDEEDSTVVSSKRGVYKPQRRRAVAAIPLVLVVALAAAVAAWMGLSHRKERAAAAVDAAAAAAPGPAGPTASSAAPAPESRPPSLATLVVVTEPVDAQVYLDQKLVKPGGTRPFVTERLAPEVAHLVEARKEGFKDAAASVTVAKGGSREILLRLRSANPVLTVRTTPPGAMVYIDGIERGRTPAALATVPPGAHVLRVELRCYSPVEQPVALGDTDRSIDLTLESLPGACPAPRPAETGEPGFLRLSSRPPARVYVDGEDTGQTTPVINLSLPPGKHQVRLEADGRSDSFEVDIRPGKVTVMLRALR